MDNRFKNIRYPKGLWRNHIGKDTFDKKLEPELYTEIDPAMLNSHIFRLTIMQNHLTKT